MSGPLTILRTPLPDLYHIYTLYRLFGMIYCHTWAPLPISTWIEIFLVFSFQVGPQSDLIIIIFMFLKSNLKSPKLSFFLGGRGGGSRKDHLVPL